MKVSELRKLLEEHAADDTIDAGLLQYENSTIIQLIVRMEDTNDVMEAIDLVTIKHPTARV